MTTTARPHASERLGARDPAELAKRVRKNHNVCALLLRLLDRDEWRDTSSRTSEQLSTRALTSARKAGLAAWPNPMVGGGLQLTVLGRQVAELVRPPRWTMPQEDPLVTPHAVEGPDGDVVTCMGIVSTSPRLARRITDLLNADDLAAAKVYKVKS